MNRELIGGIIFVSPFLAIIIISYIGGWIKAIDDYQRFDDESGIIALSLFTIVSIVCSIGLYLLLSK